MLEILSTLPRGRVLDCPAGEGALVEKLIAAGFDLRACDLYDELFRLDDVEIKKGDLSGTLPYAGRSFDYITSLDGLEHIDSPPQAFREYRRLLKPGGHLVISVPNIMNIEERLKWLLFGYNELRYYLELNGFEIQGVYRDRVKAKQWLYFPIVALIRLAAALTPEARRQDRWTRELASDPVLLGGNTLIIHSILKA